jgi:hypothetical protein
LIGLKVWLKGPRTARTLHGPNLWFEDTDFFFSGKSRRINQEKDKETGSLCFIRAVRKKARRGYLEFLCVYPGGQPAKSMLK